MSSEVDICNLALSHIGDEGTIASIDPPEQSAQAELCAKYYGMARDATLEHPGVDWSFALTRTRLSRLANETAGDFAFAYAVPSKLVRVVSIFHPDSGQSMYDSSGLPGVEPYVLEINSAGTRILRTNLDEVMCKHITKVTDTTKFSALFKLSVSWRLAGMIAGSLIGGKAGAQVGLNCENQAVAIASGAAFNDINQHHVQRGPGNSGHTPYSIQNR